MMMPLHFHASKYFKKGYLAIFPIRYLTLSFPSAGGSLDIIEEG
jgi:hypothetical protein